MQDVTSSPESRALAQRAVEALHVFAKADPNVTAGPVQQHQHPDDGFEFTLVIPDGGRCHVAVYPAEEERKSGHGLLEEEEKADGA